MQYVPIDFITHLQLFFFVSFFICLPSSRIFYNIIFIKKITENKDAYISTRATHAQSPPYTHCTEGIEFIVDSTCQICDILIERHLKRPITTATQKNKIKYLFTSLDRPSMNSKRAFILLLPGLKDPKMKDCKPILFRILYEICFPCASKKGKQSSSSQSSLHTYSISIYHTHDDARLFQFYLLFITHLIRLCIARHERYQQFY